jgi:hypothetical protein
MAVCRWFRSDISAAHEKVYRCKHRCVIFSLSSYRVAYVLTAELWMDIRFRFITLLPFRLQQLVVPRSGRICNLSFAGVSSSEAHDDVTVILHCPIYFIFTHHTFQSTTRLSLVSIQSQCSSWGSKQIPPKYESNASTLINLLMRSPQKREKMKALYSGKMMYVPQSACIIFETIEQTSVKLCMCWVYGKCGVNLILVHNAAIVRLYPHFT